MTAHLSGFSRQQIQQLELKMLLPRRSRQNNLRTPEGRQQLHGFACDLFKRNFTSLAQRAEHVTSFVDLALDSLVEYIVFYNV